MNEVSAGVAIPGWYGKLPFLGDFASRRLPTSFLTRWDDWLQASVYGARSLLGEQWLPTYLNSPVWHFSIAPGICGNNAWFGLLMSSVDRANRHFPFTLAHPVPPEGLHDLALGTVTSWLDSMEPEIVAMLDLDASVEQLEDRLLHFAPPPMQDDTRPRVAENFADFFDVQGTVSASDVPSLLSAQVTAASQNGIISSLWWTGEDDAGQASITACRSLPSAEAYCEMLGA